MKKNRVFLIVLDSFGIGALPDAAAFGDKGSNTLKSIATSPKFFCPNLEKLGLSQIDGVSLPQTETSAPMGVWARMAEQSQGKDTTTGHWEICSVISQTSFPTYPNGFPDEIIKEFSIATGRGVLCNRPYSGTKVIADYGEEHLKTGKLIVYTSADSVFQIAAHEDVVDLDTLYHYCQLARVILRGIHGVARVIARPFAGETPSFYRTSNRRDFSLSPPKETLLDLLQEKGLAVIGVGKIRDIFNGAGITQSYGSHTNEEGMAVTERLVKTQFRGLCFVNLVDFDMLYGHRNDREGYAAAMSAFDCWLGDFLPQLGEEDILMITGDHGCDPSAPGTDHSREYTPLLLYSLGIVPKNLGTRHTFADIGKTIGALFHVDPNKELDGISFLEDIL